MKTQIEIGIEGSVLSTVGTHTYCELKLEEIVLLVSNIIEGAIICRTLCVYCLQASEIEGCALCEKTMT